MMFLAWLFSKKPLMTHGDVDLQLLQQGFGGLFVLLFFVAQGFVFVVADLFALFVIELCVARSFGQV